MTAAHMVAQPAEAGPLTGIRRLMVRGYRSYKEASATLDVGPADRPVVLHGPNGAGKTNILEAISWFAPGRGLRNAKLRDVQSRGSDAHWTVAIRLEKAGDLHDLGTGLETGGDDDSERRVARVNGAAASGPGAFQDYLSFLWLTPAQDRLFMEGASDRRRFFDRMVLTLHSHHGREVARFEKAMRERALLLEKGNGDPRWLDALEAQMAEAAVAITAARRDLLSVLVREMPALTPLNFPAAVLALEGGLEGALDRAPALAVEDAYRETLARNRAVDGSAGRATEGPHRTDLAVSHAGKDMPARLCSTGEQKALLISLILAQARLVGRERGEAPFLLLDEIAAHLDGERRASLYDALLGLGTQSWLTGTEPHPFEALKGRAHFIAVREGRLMTIV